VHVIEVIDIVVKSAHSVTGDATAKSQPVTIAKPLLDDVTTRLDNSATENARRSNDDEKVTQHSSTEPTDVVCSKVRRVPTVSRLLFKGIKECSHCGGLVDPLLRRDYLQQTQRTQSHHDPFRYTGATDDSR